MQARQIVLNIGLTPILEYDGKNDQYFTYYKEFPQAIAIGDTEADAENRLIHLVENMWSERKDELAETLRTYLTDGHHTINAKLV